MAAFFFSSLMLIPGKSTIWQSHGNPVPVLLLLKFFWSKIPESRKGCVRESDFPFSLLKELPALAVPSDLPHGFQLENENNNCAHFIKFLEE